MMVRTGLARPASPPAGVELGAVGPFRGVAVVLLLDVRVERGVGEIALAAAALVGPAFIVVLAPAFVALLAHLALALQVTVVIANRLRVVLVIFLVLVVLELHF